MNYLNYFVIRQYSIPLNWLVYRLILILNDLFFLMITMVLCRLLIILTFCAILNGLFNLFQLLDVKFSNLVVKAENDAEDTLKKRREQLGVYMVIFLINKSYARVVNN